MRDGKTAQITIILKELMNECIQKCNYQNSLGKSDKKPTKFKQALA